MIQGHSTDRFAPVRSAFEENFLSRGEVGAATAIYLGGKCVVDLWGGYADEARSRPWERDTITCMMSVAKAITALCAWRLIDQGRLDLDATVAFYWPEFAQNGKSDITVRQVVGHTSGVYYFDLDYPDTIVDWDKAVEALAAQAPVYVPGSRGGYHTVTYGHLVGEIVRRVSGMPLRDFLAQEITGPLGLDYHLGLDLRDFGRVADVLVNPALQQPVPDMKQARQFLGLPMVQDLQNSELWRTSVLPFGNGHGNARAVGKLFGVLAVGGEIDGYRLFSPSAIGRMGEVAWDDMCWMWGVRFRTAMGFLRNCEGSFPVGPNDETFGTAGNGGHTAFADPVTGLGFAYSPNFPCGFAQLGDRCEALIEAAYSCI